MKTCVLTALIFSQSIAAFGNSTFTRQQFIDSYATLAVEEMMATGIPASIKLAQAVIESGWGRARTAVEGNNFFNIKCYNGWKGDTIQSPDDEKGPSCFRVYSNYVESFKDHSRFLSTQPRYRALFQYHPTDYVSWAKGLKACGYATKSDYDQILVNAISNYGLYMYDYALPARIELQANVIKSNGGLEFSSKSENGEFSAHSFRGTNAREQNNEAILVAPIYRISAGQPKDNNSGRQETSHVNRDAAIMPQTKGSKIRVIQPLPDS